MFIILRRAVVPLLLVIGGIAVIVYGIKFHLVPALETHKSETTVMVPDLSSPRPPPFLGMDPRNELPKFIKKTVWKTTEETIYLAEPAMIRDATFGGLVLNEEKKLKRTYSGKPPSLCPT